MQVSDIMEMDEELIWLPTLAGGVYTLLPECSRLHWKNEVMGKYKHITNKWKSLQSDMGPDKRGQWWNTFFSQNRIIQTNEINESKSLTMKHLQNLNDVLLKYKH